MIVTKNGAKIKSKSAGQDQKNSSSGSTGINHPAGRIDRNRKNKHCWCKRLIVKQEEKDVKTRWCFVRNEQPGRIFTAWLSPDRQEAEQKGEIMQNDAGWRLSK